MTLGFARLSEPQRQDFCLLFCDVDTEGGRREGGLQRGGRRDVHTVWKDTIKRVFEMKFVCMVSKNVTFQNV